MGMKTKGKGVSLSQLWKRNAVVAAIALFVCAAVYLNWNYEQETAAGKTLGESTMVDGQTEDPLVGASGTAGQEDPTAGTGEAGQTSSSNSYFATARPQPPAGPGQRPDPAPRGGCRGGCRPDHEGPGQRHHPGHGRTTPSPRPRSRTW